MKTLSFIAMLLGLSLPAAAIYLYFTGHFAAMTMYTLTAVGLFFFSYALMVTLRLFKPVDASKNTFSPTSSFSPPANY